MLTIEWKSGDTPDPSPVADHVERIEQCGDDGDQLIRDYGPMFTARLERVG